VLERDHNRNVDGNMNVARKKFAREISAVVKFIFGRKQQKKN